MERRIVVGAIGGDRQGDAARTFGAEIARSGCILLTGGGDLDGDEVKDASRMGAIKAKGDGVAARFIGILPSHIVDWRPSPHQLLLFTGQPHNVRNFINGVTPDVVVVFGGSRGTLAEAAFAAAAGRQLFFYAGPQGGAVARLKSNLLAHFTGIDAENNLATYFNAPLQHYADALGRRWTAIQLRDLLADVLATAVDFPQNGELLCKRCIEAIGSLRPARPTAFPGLPGRPESNAEFEAEVLRISA